MSYPIVVPVGSILNGYTVYLKKNTTSATTIYSGLARRANNSDTVTTIGGAGDSTNANAPGYISTLSEDTLLYTTLATEQYFVFLNTNDADTNDYALNVDVRAFVPM